MGITLEEPATLFDVVHSNKVLLIKRHLVLFLSVLKNNQIFRHVLCSYLSLR